MRVLRGLVLLSELDLGDGDHEGLLRRLLHGQTAAVLLDHLTFKHHLRLTIYILRRLCIIPLVLLWIYMNLFCIVLLVLKVLILSG